MKNSLKTLAALVVLVAAAAFAQTPDNSIGTKAAPEAKAAKAAPAKTEKVASAAPSGGAKNCDELKASVAEKIEAKGVKTYTLEIVANDEVKGGKVVGSCGGGTKKIVYTKG